MSVNEKMTAIADAIRAKTGGTAPLTLDGMAQAIAGIRAEGGGGLAYDMGEFVLDADHTSYNNIPHNLGAIPDFVLVWSDDFVGREVTTDLIDQVGYVYLNGLTGLPQYLTSALASDWGVLAKLARGKNSDRITVGGTTSAAYMPSEGSFTSNFFALISSGTSQRWRAGVTYKYFVSKAWWNVGGVENAG